MPFLVMVANGRERERERELVMTLENVGILVGLNRVKSCICFLLMVFFLINFALGFEIDADCRAF